MRVATNFQLPADFLMRTIAVNQGAPADDENLLSILKHAAEWSRTPADQWSDESAFAAGELSSPSAQSDRHWELIRLQRQRKFTAEEQEEFANLVDLDMIGQFLKTHGMDQALRRGLRQYSIGDQPAALLNSQLQHGAVRLAPPQ